MNAPLEPTSSCPSIPSMLSRLWHHLAHRRRVQFVLLLGLMLISTFAEVVSLGAVLPFLGMLTAPDRVFDNAMVAKVAQAWGITAADQLLLPLTVGFIAAALLAGAIRILLLWVNARLAFAGGADLSYEVYRRTLYQPYHVHVVRNTSEVISGITNKVHAVVFGVLLQALMLMSGSMLLVVVMLAVIAIDPFVAMVAGSGFGVSYALISGLSRQRLHRNSEIVAVEYTQAIKVLQEGLGGIRDVLLDGTQPIFCDIYRRSDQQLRRAQCNLVFIGGSPRYAMEALGMALIAALAYGLSSQPGGIATALPVLGALALGATRLLPALQQSYNAWVSIVGNYASLVDVVELLDQQLPEDLSPSAPLPLPFCDAIHLDTVSFQYSSDGGQVLDGIDLTIPKGSRIGIVGSTGCGKSTLLDVLMGLLAPTEGELRVDEQVVSGTRVRAWQRTIAHVPQSVYLADATIAENIAFGVPVDAIDMDRVRQAAHQAQIADFIENRPDGYRAYVGERGIRLSGGQRQRIGIARALYKQASVLVFDEATSALDSATELAVMTAIDGLNRDLTIVIIAHRLTTVKRCDVIVELEQGRIVAKGTYEHLLESSPSFRQMALAA